MNELALDAAGGIASHEAFHFLDGGVVVVARDRVFEGGVRDREVDGLLRVFVMA